MLTALRIDTYHCGSRWQRAEAIMAKQMKAKVKAKPKTKPKAKPKAKPKTKARRTGRRITLIQSDENPAAMRARMKLPRGRRLVDVELFVRSPDSAAQRRLDVGARLCSCRRVCVMFV
jgi:hypothetical protein